MGIVVQCGRYLAKVEEYHPVPTPEFGQMYHALAQLFLGGAAVYFH